MLFVVDIGLIGFLAMHAYRDGTDFPNGQIFISVLIDKQLMDWIGSKSRSLGVWRVPSWTLNEIGCTVLIHLGTGATAFARYPCCNAH